MGICSSCASEGHQCSPTTKVILEDGKLLELAGPVRAAQVLSKGSDSFVCDADGMEFDGYVTAMSVEEELQPGQLYFVLPLSMLKRRLHPEEMAALAVRASASLLEGGSSAAFGDPHGGEGWEEGGRRAAPVGGFSVGPPGVAQGRRKGKGSGRGRYFRPKLGSIPEEHLAA